VYIKYLQVQSLTRTIAAENGVSHTFNKVALSVGLTSCVGLSIVANFQESNVIVVHLLGAFLCFAAGTVYFILQVSVTTTLL
jgi:predicted membrane channel-forming protein YqfA (hemolysin III family)